MRDVELREEKSSLAAWNEAKPRDMSKATFEPAPLPTAAEARLNELRTWFAHLDLPDPAGDKRLAGEAAKLAKVRDDFLAAVGDLLRGQIAIVPMTRVEFAGEVERWAGGLQAMAEAAELSAQKRLDGAEKEHAGAVAAAKTELAGSIGAHILDAAAASAPKAVAAGAKAQQAESERQAAWRLKQEAMALSTRARKAACDVGFEIAGRL